MSQIRLVQSGNCDILVVCFHFFNQGKIFKTWCLIIFFILTISAIIWLDIVRENLYQTK